MSLGAGVARAGLGPRASGLRKKASGISRQPTRHMTTKAKAKKTATKPKPKAKPAPKKPAPKAKAKPAPKKPAPKKPAPKAKAAPKKPAPKKARAAPKANPKAKPAPPKPEALRPRPEARGPRPARATPAKPAPPPFPEWQPYPKLRRAQLTDAQAAWLEHALASGSGHDLQYSGLFSRPEHNRRFLAGPPGPSDVAVMVGGQRIPLWNAVADVASGHADHGEVLAAFAALPPGAALAAWEEIARGDAYDLHAAHALTFAEAGTPRTRNNVAHRTRFYGWMADASLAMGDAGRRAAEALAASTTTDRHGAPEAFVSMLALTRHARGAGGVLDPRHDALVATLGGEGAETFAAPVVQEIYDAIPEDRAAWLPPIMT